MKIIFLGHTSIHAALVAANIYLGKIKDGKMWMIKDLGDVYKDRYGSPLYIGRDREGTEVYTMGGGKELDMVKKSIEDLRDILGYKNDDLFIETILTRWDGLLGILIKIPAVLGGSHINYFASRALLRKKYKEIEDLVTDIKGKMDLKTNMEKTS